MFQTIKLHDGDFLAAQIIYTSSKPGEPVQRELCILDSNTLKVVEPGAGGWRRSLMLDLFGNPARALPESAIQALKANGAAERRVGDRIVVYELVDEGSDLVKTWDHAQDSIRAHREWSEEAEKAEVKTEVEELRGKARELHSAVAELQREERELIERKWKLTEELSKLHIRSAVKQKIKGALGIWI